MEFLVSYEKVNLSYRSQMNSTNNVGPPAMVFMFCFYVLYIKKMGEQRNLC
jgi:hypothetical protein